jgi:hypothetical protein
MFQRRKGRTYRRPYLKLDIAMPMAHGYQPRMLCLRHLGPNCHRLARIYQSNNPRTSTFLRFAVTGIQPWRKVLHPTHGAAICVGCGRCGWRGRGGLRGRRLASVVGLILVRPFK